MKEKKRILILGAGFMQGQAIRAAKELNCEVIAVDGNPNAACAYLADIFYPIDLKDVTSLIKLGKELKNQGGLDGVFTAATDFSASVAAVAQACSLPGHSLTAAVFASDKIKMRQCFEKAGVPSPLFTEIKKDDIECAKKILTEKKIHFPVAVKPCDNMGARGCKLVRKKEELQTAIENAVKYSRSGKVIVEEFIDGEEFSLEALVINSEIFVTAIADRHIFFPPYFVEMGHTIPSAHSKEETDELIRVFKLGIKALGLTNGAAKGDIFLRKKTIGGATDPLKNEAHRTACIGEIAARLSGGYMSGWTVPYSSGLPVTRAAVRIALGEEVPELKKGSPFLIVPTKENIKDIKKGGILQAGFSAERAWISIPGKIKKIYGLEDARTTEYVRDVLPRCFENDETVFPRNNVEKCGNVLSAAPSYNDAVKASAAAVQKIVLRLEAQNKKTDEFLFNINKSVKNQNNYEPNFFTFTDNFAKSLNGNFEEALRNSVLSEYNGIIIPSCFTDCANCSFDLHGLSIERAVRTALKIEQELKPFILKTQALNSRLNGTSVQLWLAFIRGSVQGLLYIFDCKSAR